MDRHMGTSHSGTARRIGWIDAARALGAASIVLLHVLVSTNLALPLSTGRQVAYAIVGIVGCRWAVPAFFMLTGYLLLDPGRTVGWKNVRAHVVRMLVALATFGTAFALIEEVWVRLQQHMELGPVVAFLAVRDVLTMQTWDHLWFVYALAGVYLLVPALRWVRERFGPQAFRVLTLVLFVGVLVVPTLCGGAPVAGPLSSFVLNVAVGCACCCVGGCLGAWRLRPGWVAAGIGSAVIMVVVSISGIGAGVGDRGFVFLQGSCFACAYAVFVLLALRWFVGEGPLDADGIAQALARDSFGIYLIHPLFVHLAMLVVTPERLVPVVYEATLFAAVLLASVLATRVLRRIPFLQDVL